MRKGDIRADRLWQPSQARACVAVLGLIAVLAWQVGASPTPAAAAASTRVSSHNEPTIRLKLIGTSYTQVYTDGVRWAVYEPTAGVTRIMDTIKGTSTTRPDPEGCAGGLLAIGGGEILYACSDPECPEAADACRIEKLEKQREIGRWVVEDIASGAQHLLAEGGEGLPVDVFGGLSGLDAIGSEWAVGGIATPFGGVRFFLDWHSAHIIYEREKEGEAEAGEEPTSANTDYENLDSEALLTPLCRPLTRPLAPTQERLALPRYFPTKYVPPFMIQEHINLSEVRQHAYLQRCGSTREELIPEIGTWEGQLGSGVLTGFRRLWRLNPHGRPWLGQSYRLMGPSKKSTAREVGHTSTMVFDTIEQPVPTKQEPHPEGAPTERGPGFYAVWVGRLPWVNVGR